jgi:hypothetical protein
MSINQLKDIILTLFIALALNCFVPLVASAGPRITSPVLTIKGVCPGMERTTVEKRFGQPVDVETMKSGQSVSYRYNVDNSVIWIEYERNEVRSITGDQLERNGKKLSCTGTPIAKLIKSLSSFRHTTEKGGSIGESGRQAVYERFVDLGLTVSCRAGDISGFSLEK